MDQIYLEPLHNPPQVQFPEDFRETTSIGDARVLDLGRRWFRHCVQNHPGCGYNQQDYLPTRLVDMSPGLGNGLIRIIKPTSKIPGGYVTLSHRWSSTTPKLTEDLANVYSCSLSLTKLPGLFKDVVEVARIHNVRYLWVDSLCIVQDDKHDVGHEMTKMDDIYSHAECNIMALVAQEEALFSSRDPSRVDWQPNIMQMPGTSAFLYVMVRNRSPWQKTVERAPLAGRAWVLQERYLARRKLYFGKDQICWECRESRCSESFPTFSGQGGKPVISNLGQVDDNTFDSWSCFGITDSVHSSINMDLIEHLTGLDRMPSDPSVEELQERASNWATFVSGYPSLHLTFMHDKLAAISGIAKRFSNFTGLQYVAGMWLEFLPGSLLWSMRHPSRPVPETYRCPSWSWAS